MTQFDKLLARILHLDNDLRFAELKKVLEKLGYKMYAPKSGSSHYTFRKPGKTIVTIPKHEPIKIAYVKLVKQAVEDEE